MASLKARSSSSAPLIWETLGRNEYAVCVKLTEWHRVDIAIHCGVLPIEDIILSGCALEMSSLKKKKKRVG